MSSPQKPKKSITNFLEFLHKLNSKDIYSVFIVLTLLIAGVLTEDNVRTNSFEYLSLIFYLSAYLISGWSVLRKAIKNIFSANFFDENFLMTIATVGAILIGEFPEAVTVMLLYNVGELFQKTAVNNSRNSIRALLAIRPEYAHLRVNDELIDVNPAEVKINDILVVKPGEKIPLDGLVISGSSYVDTFILTGESVPQTVAKDSNILAGMINKSGMIEIRVTKLFSESSFAKIMHLIEYASHKKAKTEKFITKFAKVYSPVIVIIAAIIAILPPLIYSNQLYSEWIYRALVILVVSCPCALVISIPLSYFGGLGSASNRGILIKGSNHLDTLAALNTVVFDKTGTLTKGVFKVSDIQCRNDFSKEDILRYAFIAESNSNHPIADSVREAYGKEFKLSDDVEHTEISGLGVKVRLNGDEIIVGNDKLLHAENIEHDVCGVEGTVIHVAVNKVYAGYIIISDELKSDAQNAIKMLKSLGIEQTIMLSGDNSFATTEFAKKIRIDSSFSELLPEDKVTKLEEIMTHNKTGKVAFVGDGINDAPVIARADLGIAMGGLGSDAAIEAADIVIMEDQPSKVAEAIMVARKTRRIVWQNLIFSLLVKGIFVLLGGIGIASMWEAVFGDMGVALIAIINATRIFKT